MWRLEACQKACQTSIGSLSLLYRKLIETLSKARERSLITCRKVIRSVSRDHHNEKRVEGLSEAFRKIYRKLVRNQQSYWKRKSIHLRYISTLSSSSHHLLFIFTPKPLLAFHRTFCTLTKIYSKSIRPIPFPTLTLATFSFISSRSDLVREPIGLIELIQ